MTYEEIRKDPAIRVYITQADASLGALGFTEHSFAHVCRVADMTGDILASLGHPERTVELGKIAGYLHDIGNLVNRVEHSQSGAVMAFRILDRMNFPAEEIAAIVTAIGNHDEGTGVPVNPVAAALILADKSDVRRSRVRETDPAKFDAHDRVNYSVMASTLVIHQDTGEIVLGLTVDTQFSTIMDFFAIFTERMMLCRQAAAKLGLQFRLSINGQTIG